jgi:hypothetical protein
MDLGDVLHRSEIDQIARDKKLVFHTTGDTGNFKNDLDVADLCGATPNRPTRSSSIIWAT